MIVEYIRYEVPEAEHKNFLSAYRAAGDDLSASPECRTYEVAQGVEEPDHFVVRIEWESVEAHEHGFRHGPHFASFFAKVQPFFPKIREMKHYQISTEGTGNASE